MSNAARKRRNRNRGQDITELAQLSECGKASMNGADRVERATARGDHRVGATHLAPRRLQHGGARVFKMVAGLQKRLFADHARTVNVFHLSSPVCDDPMTTAQLQRLRSLVADTHRLRKHVPLRAGNDRSGTYWQRTTIRTPCVSGRDLFRFFGASDSAWALGRSGCALGIVEACSVARTQRRGVPRHGIAV
jgi:hypothetical protein